MTTRDESKPARFCMACGVVYVTDAVADMCPGCEQELTRVTLTRTEFGETFVTEADVLWMLAKQEPPPLETVFHEIVEIPATDGQRVWRRMRYARGAARKAPMDAAALRRAALTGGRDMYFDPFAFVICLARPSCWRDEWLPPPWLMPRPMREPRHGGVVTAMEADRAIARRTSR